MKRHKWMKSAAGLLMAILIFPCLALTALASESIDTGRESSLTVVFEDGDRGISDTEFSLYRVADLLENGKFRLTGDFKEYPVIIDGLDSAGWRALAQTLDGFVSRDRIPCQKTAGTDVFGRAEFSELSVGLYLVVGERIETDGCSYMPEPFLVSLPGYNPETGTWEYSVTSSCKFDVTEIPQQPQTISRKVLKVWKDDGNEKKRPKNIRVQLLHNGELFETVTLSQENNWRYEWENLDADAHWQVTEEKTPEGYTVSVDQEGITFVMTNSFPTDEPEIPDEPTLPQTGMLWWPIPMLVAAGLLVYFFGWRTPKDDEKDEQ